MPDVPLVSTVIPTRNRPELVTRAVRSALAQSYRNLEVIVVIDGPDECTSMALAQIDDPRLRLIALAESKGGASARNSGVEAARGEWIALLDDDDEWLPEKTECQLRIAQQSRHRIPIVSSRFIARTPQADYLWPRRIPEPSEHVGDYLFSRRTFFKGEGLMVTPTLFTKRDLLLAMPFRAGMRKHQDWDWVLRASSYEGVGIEFESKALAIVYMEENRPGISNADDWQYSRSWIREIHPYLTDRAYGAFLLTVVADQAARQTNMREYGTLLQEAMRDGKPQAFHLLLYAGIRLFPREQRQQLRYWLRSKS